jgi:histidinol-phosphate aminotransferase
MNILIPEHIAAIKSYQPGKTISQLKKQYGWERVAILWNNENTLGYSKKSMAAVMEVFNRSNYYPDPQSTGLRKRLAEKFGRKPNEIIVGNGSESILLLAIRALCSGEDEFLTSEGTFVVVYNWARMNNVRCVSMPMTEGYGFSLDAIKSRINRSTKVIYLANANNPTGTKISKKELTTFLETVPDHVLVILDEAYFEFSQALDPEFPDSLTFDRSNILTLRTFSKAYGIAGVRLGYGIGHPKIIEAMNKAKLTFEPSTLAQAAGIGALQDENFVERTIENNKRGLTYFYAHFDRLGIRYVPSYANFVMTIWESANQVQELCDELMKVGVLVRPLSGKLDNCIRVSVGRMDENEWFIENLEKLLPQKEEPQAAEEEVKTS